MRRVVAMTAALVSAAFVLTAQPSASNEDTPPSGQPCGMATSDANSPGFQLGTVWGGPAIAEAEAGPFAIRCSVQVGTPDPLAEDVAAVMGMFGNPAVLGPSGVEFSVADGASVYLCTEYVFLGGRVVRHDADRQLPGDQCDSAHHASAAGRHGYLLMPNEFCVWYDETSPRTEVCVPFLDEPFRLIFGG